MNTYILHTMDSLYRLEVANINADGEIPPDEREVFEQVRTTLKNRWEDTVYLLKQCYSFGEDVALLRASMTTGAKDDLEEIVQDMASTCKTCIGIAEALVQNRDGTASQTDDFAAHLDPSGDTVVLDDAHRDQNALPHTCVASATGVLTSSPNYPRKITIPVGNTQRAQTIGYAAQFLVKNIHAPSLESQAAIEDAKNSIKGILHQLRALLSFLKTQYDLCQQCRAGLEDPAHALTPTDVQNIATRWKGYQTDILSSISSISKTCDAVVIQAVGIPRRERRVARHFYPRRVVITAGFGVLAGMVLFTWYLLVSSLQSETN